jgi:LuxR family transcriptional regulator, maltose regulon positive regulatory protein
MTAELPRTPLLAMKHSVPPVRRRAAPRDRLMATLHDAGTRLTTVVAPAGWGKTSLLSAWAATAGEQRIAWVSLDDADDEPTRFWTYVFTALHVSGDVSDAALAALAAPGVGPVDLALPILLNELAAVAVPHVLVLDDYHVLTDPVIHEGVEFLVTYLPATAGIVLSGRRDPPLPLARLRVRGDLTELRAVDLRFTVAEATALLTGITGTSLDRATVTTACERTEGWAAGLQLTALALRTATGPAPAVPADRHLLDYFASEVLPALAPEQRDLLVRTAPLEHLSGPLCDAALETTGSTDVLDALDRADLFVVPLDPQHRWYRCHRLLRDVLLREPGVDPVDRAAVLRRSADWFADHGRVDDAVRHRLGAGDDVAAAAQLTSAERWFVEHGLTATFLEFGEQLPAALVAPQLALALAYAASTAGRPDRISHWLDACDAQLTDDTVVPGWKSAHAAALTTRAVFGLPDGDADRALEMCREAVALETDAGHPMAAISLGTVLARAGRFEEAVPILRRGMGRADMGAWTPGVALQVGGIVAMGLLELGDDDGVDAVLREVGPDADHAEQRWGAAASPMVALIRLAQGRRSYQRGEGEPARAALVAAAEHAELVTRPSTRCLAYVFLAEAHLAVGDRGAARTALHRAREIVADEPATPFAMRRLAEAESRTGRAATRSARRSGALVEDLTDRELSVLRALPGSASQREIGGSLYLSINTVKAYTKSLYRKLGVGSRQEAVAVARELGLI